MIRGCNEGHEGHDRKSVVRIAGVAFFRAFADVVFDKVAPDGALPSIRPSIDVLEASRTGVPSTGWLRFSIWPQDFLPTFRVGKRRGDSAVVSIVSGQDRPHAYQLCQPPQDAHNRNRFD